MGDIPDLLDSTFYNNLEQDLYADPFWHLLQFY